MLPIGQVAIDDAPSFFQKTKNAAIVRLRVLEKV
jgi:hypothetical protein